MLAPAESCPFQRDNLSPIIYFDIAVGHSGHSLIWFGVKGLFYQQGVKMDLDLLCLKAREVIQLARYLMVRVIMCVCKRESLHAAVPCSTILLLSVNLSVF